MQPASRSLCISHFPEDRVGYGHPSTIFKSHERDEIIPDNLRRSGQDVIIHLIELIRIRFALGYVSGLRFFVPKVLKRNFKHLKSFH